MKKFFSQFFIFVLYLIAGGMCGYFGIAFFKDYYLSIITAFYVLGAFYICIFLQVIIHECGHLIFGLLSGYQFLSIRFYNFMWVKRNDKIVFKINKVPGTLGQCLMSIDHYQEPFPFVLYHLGGVFNNLISSLISFIICLIIHNPYLQSFCFSLGIFGLISALTNGLPLNIGIDNDAKNVFNMMKYPITKYACFQQLKIIEYMSKGYSLKDINEDNFTIYSNEDLTHNLCMSITVFYCLREIDLSHYQKAYDIADHILNQNIQMEDNTIYLLKNIVLYILILTDPQNPKINNIRDKKYLKMTKLLKRELTTLKIEYAYQLLSCHNPVKAKKILEQFHKACLTHPYLGEIESETRQIEMIQNLYKEKSL